MSEKYASWVTLRPQSDCSRRGEAEVRIFNFKTTWSEFQKPSQTAATLGIKKLCVLAHLWYTHIVGTSLRNKITDKTHRWKLSSDIDIELTYLWGIFVICWIMDESQGLRYLGKCQTIFDPSKQLFQLPRLSVLPSCVCPPSVCPKNKSNSCSSITKCH